MKSSNRHIWETDDRSKIARGELGERFDSLVFVLARRLMQNEMRAAPP